jgi:hypothetical protein
VKTLCSQLVSPKKAQTVAGRKRFRYLQKRNLFNVTQKPAKGFAFVESETKMSECSTFAAKVGFPPETGHS